MLKKIFSFLLLSSFLCGCGDSSSNRSKKIDSINPEQKPISYNSLIGTWYLPCTKHDDGIYKMSSLEFQKNYKAIYTNIFYLNALCSGESVKTEVTNHALTSIPTQTGKITLQILHYNKTELPSTKVLYLTVEEFSLLNLGGSLRNILTAALNINPDGTYTSVSQAEIDAAAIINWQIKL